MIAASLITPRKRAAHVGAGALSFIQRPQLPWRRF